MKIGEIVFAIVMISALFLIFGIALGSGMQEAETNNVLKDLGYRLEHHHYQFDNVSSNWYELVKIENKETIKDS